MTFAGIAGGAATVHADDILVFRTDQGDFSDQAAGEARDFFTSLGHTVTLVEGLVPTLPALDAFDQVYLIQAQPLTQPQADAIVTYVKGGGRLFATGENPNVQASNDILQDEVVNRLVASANIVVGTGVAGTDVFTFTGTDKVQLASSPNPLADWRPVVPGLLGNVPAPNVITTQADGGIGAAIFAREDLVADAAGCLVLTMDVDFWYRHELTQPTDLALEAEIRDIAENLHAFLADCGDTDGDGLLDADEVAIGTGVDDPDSDDDGLCDGTVSVPAPAVGEPCIAGENAKAGQDTDGDDDIDALDPDDDNDSLPTRLELTDVGMFGNPDDDGVPAWLDLDSDGDRIFDSTEGTVDSDGDGIPDYLDPLDATSSSTGSGEGGRGGAGGGDAGVGGAGTTSGAGGASDVPTEPIGGGIFCSITVGVESPAPSLLAALAALALLGRRGQPRRDEPRRAQPRRAQPRRAQSRRELRRR